MGSGRPRASGLGAEAEAESRASLVGGGISAGREETDLASSKARGWRWREETDLARWRQRTSLVGDDGSWATGRTSLVVGGVGRRRRASSEASSHGRVEG
ncbi:hypothetical protein NL676_000012 [Syzygium grande]|nr:hypothetical protein NL676_000012 [Syzygium grande]